MTQTLSVTVPIPDTYVLIAKDEYDELLNYSLDPVWDLKELKRKLKMSSDDTIKDRLLFNPKFEKLLKQQGIAHYPDESLNRWRFNARKMNKFIDEHFEEIHRKGDEYEQIILNRITIMDRTITRIHLCRVYFTTALGIAMLISIAAFVFSNMNFSNKKTEC